METMFKHLEKTAKFDCSDRIGDVHEYNEKQNAWHARHPTESPGVAGWVELGEIAESDFAFLLAYMERKPRTQKRTLKEVQTALAEIEQIKANLREFSETGHINGQL